MSFEMRGRTGFSLALKGLREEARVSQSKLAERAGFDHSYVSRLESGTRTPTREAVEQLALALGAEPGKHDELLAAAGFLPRELGSLLTEEPELSELLNVLRSEHVPGEVQRLIREHLRILAAQGRIYSPARPEVSRPTYPHRAA